MSATVIPFPKVTWCPECEVRLLTVDLHTHRHDCPARKARLAHPSNHRPIS